MATIFQTPAQPQQLQQQSTGSAQTSTSTQDPLFQALVKHITTGPDAQNVTTSELEQLVQLHAASPQGRAYVDSLVAPADAAPQAAQWNNSAIASGKIVLTKINGSVELNVPSIARDITANFTGVLIPYSGMLQ